MPVFDTTRLHAERAVELALSVEWEDSGMDRDSDARE